MLMLTSCQYSKNAAPIVYYHKNSMLNDTTNTNKNIIVDNTVHSRETNIVTQPLDTKSNEYYVYPSPNRAKKKYQIIYYEVQVGDSIEDIASKYKQSVYEIAQLNALIPPYTLDEFQILKIRVPQNSEIQNTRQTPILNFIKPITGQILVKYGEKTFYGLNKGLNITAQLGTEIKAAASGKVIYADYDATFGYLAIIQISKQDIVTSYAHMKNLKVFKGQIIKQGEVIGQVGSTGKVNQPQLHFSIRKGKRALDPMNFIKF